MYRLYISFDVFWCDLSLQPRHFERGEVVACVSDKTLLHTALGMTVTLGKVGWKRVVDPKPYIYQNDVLTSYVEQLKDRNQRLSRQHEHDMEALAELKKILEIEGLLGKYKLKEQDNAEAEGQYKTYPRNDYSGLNSLRKRIRNRGWDGNPDSYRPMLNSQAEETDSTCMSDYELATGGEKKAVGSPHILLLQNRLL